MKIKYKPKEYGGGFGIELVPENKEDEELISNFWDRVLEFKVDSLILNPALLGTLEGLPVGVNKVRTTTLSLNFCPMNETTQKIKSERLTKFRIKYIWSSIDDGTIELPEGAQILETTYFHKSIAGTTQEIGTKEKYDQFRLLQADPDNKLLSNCTPYEKWLLKSFPSPRNYSGKIMIEYKVLVPEGDN